MSKYLTIKQRGELLEVSEFRNDTKQGITKCPHPHTVKFVRSHIRFPGFMPRHWLYKDKGVISAYTVFYPVGWDEVDFVLSLINFY